MEDIDLEMLSPILPPKRRREGDLHPPCSHSFNSLSTSVSMSSTPEGSGRTVSLASSSSGRPSGERVNPFEPFCLRSMKASIFSPSVFLASTPSGRGAGGTPEVFNGWDIKELAELFPINLESSPTSHTNPYPIDSSTEARAQEDIAQFFASGPIAPTPDDVPRKKNFLYRSPSSSDGEGDGNTADSWTNTMLSFPERLPPEVEAVLRPFFTVDCCSETEVKVGGDESRMEEEDHAPLFEDDEGGGEDSSQSSSRVDRSLQINVRRRLELSFGESTEASPPVLSGSPIHSQGPPPSA